ncbi:class I SAM-dependent methyltransferase [Candidatus Micrarchaeota archaeon]|nr:class I SAM-dependent methyltransferase [Candidatus Micrarchaeota archaeon]
MPTLRQNLDKWSRRRSWAKDGDEWSDQAAFCRVPYGEWKASVMRHLIDAHLGKGSVALEIAPGHGRWSAHIAGRAKHAILVDYSARCIAHCRKRLARHDNLSFIVNDGTALGGVQSSSVDFVFSYDSFVHMEEDVVFSYLREIRRVLRGGGRAVIHHPGRRDSTLWLWRFLAPFGEIGRMAYAAPSMGRISRNDGWRSNLSRERFAQLAQTCGLTVLSQSDSWGGGAYNCRLFSDCVSILQKD